MVQGVVIDETQCIVDVNPATGEEVARVPCTPLEEIPNIIAAAHEAQLSWANELTIDERADLVKKGCGALAGDLEGLAHLITSEMGKILSEAREEVQDAANKNEYIDHIVAANRAEVVGGSAEAQSLIVRDAMGVVAVLSPWNFPADEILLLALPALIAGNAVIIKPSEVVPLTGERVVQALQSALPPGVVQIVQGDGAIGAKLIEGEVDMVAMTGSTATGKKIMAVCAADLKRLVLELGGKDPMIVFADSDLDKAANDAVSFSLFNCGQVCCAVERIFVDEAIKQEFEDRVAAIASTFQVGNGLDETTKVGPMVSAAQRNLVTNQVDSAIEAGAKVVFQGEVPPELLAVGNFYPVTVLSEVTRAMDIDRNETFGPVVAITTFDGTEDSAVALANDTEYGLASYVYTSDMVRARRVAMRINAGQVGINCYSLIHANANCPWVGHKSSGFGYHSGPDGWRQFSVPKSIVFDTPLPAEFSPKSSL